MWRRHVDAPTNWDSWHRRTAMCLSNSAFAIRTGKTDVSSAAARRRSSSIDTADGERCAKVTEHSADMEESEEDEHGDNRHPCRDDDSGRDHLHVHIILLSDDV